MEHERALDEEHWSYMDRFAAGMVARGPTLAADRATWTGSLHILDLPSPEAAREFVEHEPYNRAGLFATHLVLRFENRLGRTMWEFPGDADEPRFLVIAQARAAAGEDAPPAGVTALAPERLIVHGALLTLDEARPVGAVLALHAPTRHAIDALIRVNERYDVQIHDWEFGGRR